MTKMRQGVKGSHGWVGVVLLSVLALAGARAAAPLGAAAEAVKKPTTDIARLRQKAARLPLSFEVNKGQHARPVRFQARGSGFQFFLTPQESVIALARRDKKRRDGKVPAAVVRSRFVGGSRSPRMVGMDKLPGKANYLIGRNPKGWHTDIATYARVRYQNVYPRIDVDYYGNGEELEHDFIVRPGAKPETIRVAYRGVRKITVDSQGELHLQTPLGEIQQKKPVAYQDVDGARRKVLARYKVLASNQLGFEVAGYDKTRPLVIDPVLRYSTYLGGDVDDYGWSLALDSDKNAYMTGVTGSYAQAADNDPGGLTPAHTNVPPLNGFPVVNGFGDPDAANTDIDYDGMGGVETTFTLSRYDAFVTKFNPDGSNLVFSSYLGGGSGDDFGFGIAVDINKNPYVTGLTNSVDWPLVNPLQARSGGGDAFVTKLTTGGNGFVYSSYLGGSGQDRARSCAVDSQNNLHVAGVTSSTDFPAVSRTGAVFQPTYGGGATDAFVVSIDASGSAFIYSTYLGGAGDESGAPGTPSFNYLATFAPYTIDVDAPFGFIGPRAIWMSPATDWTVGLALDPQGNAYVTGGTSSFSGFTSQQGGATPVVQPARSGAVGTHDAFVCKFDPDGNRIFSTFLGGSQDDCGRGISVDPSGQVYVTGWTRSDGAVAPAFPLANALQPAFGGGTCDAFVTKLNSSATAFVYSTFLGGNAEDVGSGIANSPTGQAYVAGHTFSTGATFPTRFFLQSSVIASADTFVTKYVPNGSEYEYSTPVGGSGIDRGMAIQVDDRGEAYVGGMSSSGNYPRTLGSFAGLSNSGNANGRYAPYPVMDVILSKYLSPPFAPSNLTLTDVTKNTVSLAWTDNSDNEDGFEIERKLVSPPGGNFAVVPGGIVGRNVVTFKDTNLIDTTTYTYRVRPFNQASGVTFYGPYSNQLTVTTLPDVPRAPSNLTVSPIDTQRLKLDWVDNANNEEKFKIERKLGTPTSMNPYQEIAQVPVNTITFTDTGLLANTDYTYRVRSNNVAGDSAYSNEATGKTLPNPPTVAPVLVGSSPNFSTVNLAWTYNDAMGTPLNDHTGFKIERSDDGGTTFVLIRVTTTPAVLTFQDTGLQPDKVYFYKVRAYNLSGDGPFSNTVQVRTRKAPPTGGAPVLTTTLLPGGVSVQLNWTDTTNEDFFRVERSTDNFATAATVLATLAAGTLTYTDPTPVGGGLARNTRFFYRIVAITQNVSGDTDGPTSNVDNELTKPADPTGLTAAALSHVAIQLDWTDNNPAGSVTPVQFEVERSLFGANNFSTVGTPSFPTAGGQKTFVDNTGLTPSTAYEYRVRGTNGADADHKSGYSNTVAVQTLPAPPAIPTLNSVTTPPPPAGSHALDITFTDNSDNESGFLIERSLASSFAVLDGTLSEPPRAGTGTVVTVRNSGLLANTTYFYRVKALSPGGMVQDSAYSGTLSGTTLPDPPAAPSGLTVTVPAAPTGINALNLAWTDNADNETNFRIERRTDVTGYVTAGTVGPNVTTFTDSGLAANTHYTYRVFALNAGGDSAASNEADATTLPNPPDAPSALTATLITRTSIQLTWMDNAVNETGFELQRSTNDFASVETTIPVGPATGTGTTVVFLDGGLAPDTLYSYRVRSVNPGGASPFSNVARQLTPPAAPSGLTATVVSNSSIRLFFTDNSTTEVGFKVERKLSGQPDTSFAELPVTLPANANPATPVSYIDTGLSGNTGYVYRVRAFNTFNAVNQFSDYSNQAAATTFPNQPTDPGPLTVTVVSQSQLQLDWVDNSPNEDGFKIERSTGGGPFVQIRQEGANVTTFTDSGLAANTTYTYRVRAFNLGGDSGYSNEASATTLPNPPTAPSGLTVTVLSDTQLRLNWVDNSNNETRFDIDRRTGAAGFSFRASVAANVTTFTDGGLASNTRYTYRVRAANTGGGSANSNEADGLTLPSAPINVLAVASVGKIDLTWDQPNGADGFKIERSARGAPFQEVATVAGNRRAFTDTGLIGGVDFTYRIRAFNQSGFSAFSADATATTPSGITSLTVNPGTTRGGRTVTGTVTISTPAPAGGSVVTITSNTGKVKPPRTVRIQQGQTSASFKIKTGRVNRTTVGRVTGSFGGNTAFADLTLTRR